LIDRTYNKRRANAGVWLLLFAVLYGVVVVSHWNRGYLDFGDGNYMYISWRMSEGAMLYRDVLAPQPPLHLVVGAGLARIAKVFSLPHPLYAFRAFSLLLHLGTMWLVFATARRVMAQAEMPARVAAAAPLVAAGVYLLLPIGFWWTLGYQTQPLLILWLLLTFFFLMGGSTAAAAGAGISAALAVLTNMTAVPYAVLLGLYLLVRRPRQLLAYGLPFALILGVVMTTTELITGAYIDNVVKNQVGAFPRKELLPAGDSPLQYALRKFRGQGQEVLNLEAGWLLLALAGMVYYSRRAAQDGRAELALCFSLASWGALVYVAKGGTMNYVFSLAEPYVAIFAGLMVAKLFFPERESCGREPLPFRTNTSWLAGVAAGALAAGVVLWLFWPGLRHNWRTLKQDTYELPETETLRVVDRIRQNSRPEDLVFAPPYYAFLAQRRIVEDYSELFLWRLKYMNERVDRQQGRATETVENIAQQLARREVKFLVLDLDQTGQLPEVKAAVEQHYEPLLREPIRSLNTPLQFYRPRVVMSGVGR